MAQASPRACAAAAEPPAPAPPAPAPPAPPTPTPGPPAPAPPQRTSDCYRVDDDLPARFNNPAWFRGYGTKKAVSVYRTSNDAYGSRAPTVHEMPKVFYPNSNKFSRQLAAGGMFRNNTFNVYMEKSIVTGPDNYITPFDRFNFHPSYNVNKPSICDWPAS